MIDNTISVQEALRSISVKDFLTMGMDQIAYIKPVLMENEEAGFAIHAADGRPISTISSYASAIALIHQQDMHAVTVH